MILRTIHTDMYTAKSKAILTALREYMLKKWGSSQMQANAILASVATEPNGEISWQVADHNTYQFENSWRTRTCYYSSSTYQYRRDDQKVRDWLALTLKYIIYTEFKRKHLPETTQWKRNNKAVIDCLTTDDVTVTVAEAYCLFDKLLNRKTFAKRWKKPMLKEIIGEERDAVATELEIARREEDKKLDEKFEADKKDLDRKKYEELNKIQAEIYEKYKQLQADLKVAYLESKKELADSLSFVAEGNPFA